MAGLCEGSNEPPGSLKASKYSASSDDERVMERRKFSPAPGFEPGFQLYMLMLYPLSHTGFKTALIPLDPAN
ncbi:hypothetical protein ANN_17429 [Periplaneta americana]|uniref:Uncharacterized protein n=1 Tax=Periplaneta americana TaxID=6978 RepID=A0ABQ8SSX7_PERAM|nr:hypothetical protein ANN_17429 [Periplaneta americana]